MLILSRRAGEEIHIEHAGELLRIVVHSLTLNPHKVRLGFDAPQSFIIRRDDCKRTTPARTEDQPTATEGAQLRDGDGVEAHDPLARG